MEAIADAINSLMAKDLAYAYFLLGIVCICIWLLPTCGELEMKKLTPIPRVGQEP